ncbi:MAG: ABC transporter permease, partial [Pseudomonadota bacterium]
MLFKPVILWTDALIYLLVMVVLAFVWYVRRNEHMLAPWRRVGHSASGMAALTVLVFFIAIGLLDTVHFRPAVENSGNSEKVYSVEVLSLLDVIAEPLRTRVEKTYSAPFAAHLYARETIELPDGGQIREFPRLQFGGAHLQNPAAQLAADVTWRAAAGAGLGMLVWCVLVVLLSASLARR